MQLFIHSFITYSLLLCCIDAQAQKQVQFDKQRVKSIRYYRDATSAMATDSLVFFYSEGRGSVYKAHEFYNGAVYGFRTNYMYEGSVIPATHMPEPLADLLAVNVMHDSVLRYTRVDTNVYLTKTIHIYKDSLLAGTHIYSTNNYNGSFTTFNAERLPEVIYKLQGQNFMLPDTTRVRTIGYDTDKKVLQDTTSLRRGAMPEYLTYTYDADNRLQCLTSGAYHGNMPTPVVRSRYAYDAKGKIVEVLQQLLSEMPDTTWVNQSKQHFIYDLDNRLISHSESSGEGIPRSNHEYYYNQSGDADTQTFVYIDEDVITDCDKVVFYFNEFHNPDSAITYHNYCRGGVQVQRTIYEYETYKADSMSSDSSTLLLILYPNPTTGWVHIKWNSKLPKEGTFIKVYNAVGQVVQTLYLPKPKAVDEIDLGSLPKGVYYLRITGMSGSTIYKGGVVLR